MTRKAWMPAVLCAAFALGLLVGGCQSAPDWTYRMHPSQWWKMNRQPAYDDYDNAQFSVPDPA
jgi:hypothetical protein